MSTKKIIIFASVFTFMTISAIGYMVFTVRSFKMQGDSMLPTYSANQRLITHRVNPSSVKRGDIVVLKDSVTESLLVKRVVALPKDTITYTQGRLEVTHSDGGKSIPYKDKEVYGFGTQTIPDGNIYVLGDNNGDQYSSLDSRDASFGAIPLQNIKYKVFLSL